MRHWTQRLARTRGTSVMLLGALVSALGAYLFQVIGGRSIGAEAFSPVSVIWTLSFLGFTVFLLPVEQMVIRQIVLRPTGHGVMVGRGRAIVTVVASATAIVVGVVVAFGNSLFGGDRGYVPVAAAMFISFGVFAVGRGHLAGAHRYSEYGLAVGLDAVVKVAGAVVVAITGWGPVILSWVLVLSPIVILVVRPFRDTRRYSPDDPSPFDQEPQFIGGFVVANAASQTVLAIGPVIVGALGASAAAVSVFFVTTTLFRGPMSASYHLVARALPSAIRRTTMGEHALLDRWVRRMLIGGLLLAVSIGAAAGLVGPQLVGALYGAEFTPGVWLAALAAAGVIVGIAGLATTQVLVARGETMAMAVVWLIALGVAGGTVAFTSGDPSIRVVTAFCVGETTALIGLSLSAVRRAR